MTQSNTDTTGPINGSGISYNNLSGTFTVSGTNDSITVNGDSNITVLSPTAPAVDGGNVIHLGDTTSTVIESASNSNIIYGHGAEIITLGLNDTVSLAGGQNDSVTINSNDHVNLTNTGTDFVLFNGSNNAVQLGGAISGQENTYISRSAIDNTIALRDNTTYMVDDYGSNNSYHLGSASISVTGSASDTFYALELGNHAITLPGGSNTIIVRNGTIVGHDDAITITNFVDGHDTLKLLGGAAIAQNGANVLTHITEGGSGAVLTLGSETITFAGVNVGQFHTGDFIIV